MTANTEGGYIVRFETGDILRGGADDIARSLLTTWEHTQGRLNEDMTQHMSHLVIMDGRPNDADSPDVLFTGGNSLLMKKMGAQAPSSPQIRRTAFSTDYRQLCRKAYLDTALNSQPIFDLVQITHPLSTGKFQKETYHRLLLPVFTDQGARFTLCYSLDVLSPRYPVEFEQSRQPHEAGIFHSTSLNMPRFPVERPR